VVAYLGRRASGGPASGFGGRLALGDVSEIQGQVDLLSDFSALSDSADELGERILLHQFYFLFLILSQLRFLIYKF
jgi:hypothetical protein